MKELVDNRFKQVKFLFKNSQNLFSGKYFSKLKGEGVEFCDLKSYSFGDDVRKIDWNVTARTREVFVREFLEDKDLTHYFLIDVSGSIFNKKSEIQKFVSTLLFSVNFLGDNFSVVLCSKDFFKVVPISKGKSHLLRCIYEVSSISESGFGNLDFGLKFLLEKVKKRSVVSIFSDELELSEITRKYLSALSNRNKVVFFEFFNSNELEFDLGLDAFCDSESGVEMVYDLDEDEVYEIILNFNNSLKNLERDVRNCGAKFLSFDCKFDTISSMKLERFEI